jgi:hypothetical protein
MPKPAGFQPTDLGGSAATADDPRLALIHQEALRGLLQQQAALESLRNRAGTLIFAASLQAHCSVVRRWQTAWEPGTGLRSRCCLRSASWAVVVLWPYYGLSFRFDAQELLDRYVDSGSTVTMSQMHRSLALRIRADWERSGRIVRRMREAFQLALVLLLGSWRSRRTRACRQWSPRRVQKPRPSALSSENPGRGQSADGPVLPLPPGMPTSRHAARTPPQRARQRRRDRRSPPPTRRAAPPGHAARVPARRSRSPRGAEPSDCAAPR